MPLGMPINMPLDMASRFLLCLHITNARCPFAEDRTILQIHCWKQCSHWALFILWCNFYCTVGVFLRSYGSPGHICMLYDNWQLERSCWWVNVWTETAPTSQCFTGFKGKWQMVTARVLFEQKQVWNRAISCFASAIKLRTSWIISRSGLRKPVKTSLSAAWTKRATHVLRLSLCLHDKKMEDKFGKQPMPIEMQIYNQTQWQLGKQLIPFLIKYNSNSKEKVNRPREATWDMWRVWL